jgi:ATP dependent DNA ligase C terminal region
MAKRKESRYLPGRRSDNWLKIKARMQQEAMIGGITEPSGGRKYFGALMLGVNEKGRLLYVGHTGTGFSEATLKELFTKLKPLFTDKCPFTLKPKAKLLVIRRGVGERIIEATAIPFRGVHKSVEIFLDIDRLEEQAFVTNLLGVFDQNSCGAIDAPHSKSRPKKSAVRVKFFQPRHRMETIDCDSILAIKAVIGPITDSSSVEQLLPFHAKIKRLFLDLVGSPNAHGIFYIHRELQCLIELEVPPDGDRTLVGGMTQQRGQWHDREDRQQKEQRVCFGPSLPGDEHDWNKGQ